VEEDWEKGSGGGVIGACVRARSRRVSRRDRAVPGFPTRSAALSRAQATGAEHIICETKSAHRCAPCGQPRARRTAAVIGSTAPRSRGAAVRSARGGARVCIELAGESGGARGLPVRPVLSVVLSFPFLTDNPTARASERRGGGERAMTRARDDDHAREGRRRRRLCGAGAPPRAARGGPEARFRQPGERVASPGARRSPEPGPPGVGAAGAKPRRARRRPEPPENKSGRPEASTARPPSRAQPQGSPRRATAKALHWRRGPGPLYLLSALFPVLTRGYTCGIGP